MNAIRISRGNVVCFTTSDVKTLSDWLLSFYVAYKKDENISGCGGYEVLKKNFYLKYFYEQELANKIGLGPSARAVGAYKLFPLTNDIFSINPVGLLSNSSYKKEYIQNVNLIDRAIPEIEWLLKKAAVEHGPLSFLPKFVLRRNRMTLKSFLYDNIANGFYGYIFFKKTKLEVVTLFTKIIINTLIQLSKGLSWKNIFASGVVFTGYFFRYLGKSLGMFYMWLTLINVRIKDATKIERI